MTQCKGCHCYLNMQWCVNLCILSVGCINDTVVKII